MELYKASVNIHTCLQKQIMTEVAVRSVIANAYTHRGHQSITTYLWE